MHTTSPIRRYVDLINQTQILANLKGKTKPFSNEELENDIPRIEKTLLYLKETAHKSEHYWVLEFLKQNYLNTPLDAYFRDGRNGFLRFELIPWGFVISAKCESYPLTDKLKIIIYKVDSDQGFVWADLL
jgi:exoribonuclease-2